jgi:hypothetical protein
MIATFRESEPSLSLASCVLPEVAPAADWPLLATPDSGFRVRLPPGWQMRMGDSSFGEPRTVLENDAGSRIRVARSLHASGRETLNMASSFGRPVELSHTGPCQMGTGPSGSVWTFYAPDSAAAPLPRYMALGALITAGGRAYRITVGAATAQERDRLVRIAADAARP